MSLAGHARWKWALVCFVPVCTLLTILANASRIISLFYLKTMLGAKIPSFLSDSIHLAVGIAIFLPVFIATYIIFQWRISYDD